jgi:hypothetical protein
MSEPTKEQVKAWIKAKGIEQTKIENELELTANALSCLAWDMDLARIPYNPLKSDNKKDWKWVNKSQYEVIQAKRKKK